MASCTQAMRYSKPLIGLHARICGLLIRCAPFGDNFELAESVASLAGHTLHLRRKGLVSCLYATCAAAARSAAPIKSLHVMVLCNIQCHSAARYIPATTHRDTECERVRYMSTTS